MTVGAAVPLQMREDIFLHNLVQNTESSVWLTGEEVRVLLLQRNGVTWYPQPYLVQRTDIQKGFSFETN